MKLVQNSFAESSGDASSIEGHATPCNQAITHPISENRIGEALSARAIGLRKNSVEHSSDWLTAEEAATYLRIFRKDGSPCVERLRNLSNKRRIPFYKPYGRLLFKRSELKAIIEASKQRALGAL